MSDPGRGTPIAVGWATVELDRAAAEFADRLVPGTSFEAAPDCELLGARCRVGRLAAGADAAPAGARLLVLLEPSTEGRLALTLARHGESWCATWTTPANPPPDDGPAGRVAPAGAVSVVRGGPFGLERLVLGGPADGPHHLLVQAATIPP